MCCCLQYQMWVFLSKKLLQQINASILLLTSMGDYPMRSLRYNYVTFKVQSIY